MNVEIRRSLVSSKDSKKQLSMKRSGSKGALRDTTNLLSANKKKRTSRPTSAKSNSKKSRPGSGKKDTSFRSQNKSRSRDRGKQLKSKETSHNQKLDEHLLLKSLKNTQKPSSLGPLLNILDNKVNRKVRPPKAPKQLKLSIKENLINGIENMHTNQLRSRQKTNLEKKSITITHSPNKESNLEFQKDSMKRKSSFVNVKKELGNIQLKFANSKRIPAKVKPKSILHKTQSQQALNHLYSSVSDSKHDDSLSELYNLTKQTSKKSLLESFTKGKPEIEFTNQKSQTSLHLESHSLSMSRAKKDKKSKSPTSGTAVLNPWKGNAQKYNEDKYCKNLESMANNLLKKMKESVVSQSSVSNNYFANKQSMSTKPKIDMAQDDSNNLKISKVNLRKASKTRRTKDSKEIVKDKQILKSSFSSTNLELSKKDPQKKLKISKNIFDSAKSTTIKLRNNKDIQQYVDPHESPLLKMEIELPA